MNAQTSFLDGTYTLIHVPLNLYSTFLQPILRVLLPETPNPDGSPTTTGYEEGKDGLTPDRQHIFLNVSITPIECSVVCHSAWVERVFVPAIARLPPENAATISVSKDTYLIVSVISAGLDPAGRVMELSAPLALAEIPIFFIATYFSDFILVPTKERHKVIRALIDGGFEFSENGDDSFAPSPTKGCKGAAATPSPPRTPTASLAGMQHKTFYSLRLQGVVPYIQPGLRLVQCAGRQLEPTGPEFAARHSVRGRPPSWSDNVDPRLYTALVSALVSQPSFLAITLAQDDPPSLLVDKRLYRVFRDVVVGDTANEYVPLFLDLESLPSSATGIVCGVAGGLVEEMNITDSSQLSYLSTARAGAVIMSSDQAVPALDVLKRLLRIC